MNILTLAGGESGEREVSLASARAIVAGLERLSHSVSVIDSANGALLLDQDGLFIEQRSEENSTPAVKSADSLERSVTEGNYDLVFLALHGGAGEDGTIQGLLDLAQIPYTGSGREASTIAMAKPKAKHIAQSLGIPTPDWIELTETQGDLVAVEEEAVRALGLPMIVKPANGGSTVGLTLLKDSRGFADAVRLAAKDGGPVLLERYCAGRELTVAVFGSEVWPIVEITPQSGLYDYHDKYTAGASDYHCPAEIPEPVADTLRANALRIYQAIGCRGLARVDFILDETGTGQFLEVNTLPGMTELSLAPMAAKAAGISFDQLLQKSVEAATWG